MANSLQDQLLKAGLVNEKKLKETNKQKHKQQTHQRRNKLEVEDETRKRVREAEEAKQARDRDLNLQANHQKLSSGQMRKLIEAHRLPKGAGEITFNFTDENKVHRVFVSEETREQLVKGEMAIVKFGRLYDVVPAAVACQVRDFNPVHLIVFNDATQHDGGKADDPYADYVVPDDLIW